MVLTGLAKHNFFLKVIERRDMFRFLIQKKVQAKKEVTRNLLSSAIEKFNGYEMILEDLACKERGDKAPINIALEPISEDNIPVPCFFTDQIYLAYKSYVGRFEKVKEHISNCVVKRYHYCENFCAKNDEAMKKHFSICAAREGITYAFDNGQMITFQDKGDLPFTVYFDFETTTTGGCFFLTQKCS